jgi:spore coat polysaccharide biosynthesis protein SpsF (cytidylyltransferase family)
MPEKIKRIKFPFRLTLDTNEDLIVLKSVFEGVSGQTQDLESIVEYLNKHQEIVAMMKDIMNIQTK